MRRENVIGRRIKCDIAPEQVRGDFLIEIHFNQLYHVQMIRECEASIGVRLNGTNLMLRASEAISSLRHRPGDRNGLPIGEDNHENWNGEQICHNSF